MRSFALDEMPWTEVSGALEQDDRLILPVGALEQHGPHLPLGANIVMAQRVARAVSEEAGVLRAPAFSYGVTLGQGPFAGRSGLRRKTLHRAISEVLDEWSRQGFGRFVLLSAHRYEPHLDALLMATSGAARVMVLDLYEIDTTDLLESDPEREHAGELETSLLLHLTPELVRTEAVEDFVPESGALRKYTHRRVPKPPKGSSGVVGLPAAASAEKGRLIFDRWVGAVVETLRADP